MQVHIAMPPAKAAIVDAKKALSVSSLGLPSHVKYLPLKNSEELALQAAIKGNGMQVPIARDPSSWNILGVHVPQSAAFEMVQAGTLIRDPNGRGWQLFAELTYSAFSPQWSQVTLPPMGVAAWSEMTLMPSFRTFPHESCCQCNKRGSVWRRHCGDCWLDFLQQQQQRK